MKSKILSKSEKPFESFGQPSYFNSVLIPKLFNRVTSSSSELMEGNQKILDQEDPLVIQVFIIFWGFFLYTFLDAV